jgi:peptide/nickel transport system substrate-binding protein
MNNVIKDAINRVPTLVVVCMTLIAGAGHASPWQEPVKEYELSCGRQGGQLTLATTSDPKSFNPIVAKEANTSAITAYIFEGLTRTDPVTMEVRPLLARSWEVDETGTVWTFYLRDDVKFNDGEPFTADDVVFTFNELIYNPDIPNSAQDIFTIDGKRIEVEKVDDYTLRFTLPAPFAPFLRSLGQEILPRHKYQSQVIDDSFNYSMGLDTPLSDIVGTGPFMLKEYVPGERIVLARNPVYWQKDDCGTRLPYLDRVLYVVLPSPDTSLLKFLDGEIDYFGMRAEDLSFLGPLQRTRGFTVYNGGVSFGSQFLAVNQNPGVSVSGKPFVADYKLGWFSDYRFRKALSYAVQREKIVEIVMNGLGVPQYGPMSPGAGYFYNAELAEYSYDPEKSRGILAALGFRDKDGDGILEDADGHRLTISLFTAAKSPEGILIGSMIRKDLQKVGVEIQFLPLSFNHLVTKLTATFDWEMILIGLTGGIEPHFGKNVWDSNGALHMWYPNQSAPATDWEARVDEIFNKAAQTVDEVERKSLYDEWQVIVNDQQPLIYTALPYSLYAVRDRFGNLFPTVYGGAFWNIESIYINQPAGGHGKPGPTTE